jgi:hypothetical protein
MAIETNSDITKPKKSNWFRNFLLKVALFFIIIVSVYVYWFYYNVYSDGDRTGVLTKISRKGNIFKTYEGEMMIGNIVQSTTGFVNEKFYFSVADKSIADTLIKLQGQRVTLQYQQYRKNIDWRGDAEYIITGYTKAP